MLNTGLLDLLTQLCKESAKPGVELGKLKDAACFLEKGTSTPASYYYAFREGWKYIGSICKKDQKTEKAGLASIA